MISKSYPGKIEYNTYGIDNECLKSMLNTMMHIREFEERLAGLILEKKIITPCHLYIGQEAIATGVCHILKKEDYVFGSHRSHGHYLAKGGDIKAAMAEIFCKETGCSRGRGGSMHLVAPEVGILGTSSIVAGSMAIAIGTALAESIRKTGRVSVVFHGDGVPEEGIWHESANLAALRKLPIIFVCENNFYSTHMPLEKRRVYNNLHDIASTHGLNSIVVDGNNVAEVYNAAKIATDRAIKGEGPSFIECLTYRWRGHVGPNYDIDKGLRSQEELDAWMAHCPILNFSEYLVEQGIMSNSDIKNMKNDVISEINEAVEFALSSPYPDAVELTKDVFRGDEN